MKTLAPLCNRYNEGDDTLKPQELLDGLKAAVAEFRQKVAHANKEASFTMDDDYLEAFVCGLEELTLNDMEALPSVTYHVDVLLDQLYDWCDVNRWFVAAQYLVLIQSLQECGLFYVRRPCCRGYSQQIPAHARATYKIISRILHAVVTFTPPPWNCSSVHCKDLQGGLQVRRRVHLTPWTFGIS